MDGSVVEAVGPQRLHIGGRDRGGRAGQLRREVAERPRPWLECRCAVIDLDLLDELEWGALCTEVVAVRLYSVVAVVLARHNDREQLPLHASESGRPEHDLPIQAHRLPENGRAQAHRLEDVEDLSRTGDRGVVLLLEQPVCRIDVDQAQERHAIDFVRTVRALLHEVEAAVG